MQNLFHSDSLLPWQSTTVSIDYNQVNFGLSLPFFYFFGTRCASDFPHPPRRRISVLEVDLARQQQQSQKELQEQLAMEDDHG